MVSLIVYFLFNLYCFSVALWYCYRSIVNDVPKWLYLINAGYFGFMYCRFLESILNLFY